MHVVCITRYVHAFYNLSWSHISTRRAQNKNPRKYLIYWFIHVGTRQLHKMTMTLNLYHSNTSKCITLIESAQFKSHRQKKGKKKWKWFETRQKMMSSRFSLSCSERIYAHIFQWILYNFASSNTFDTAKHKEHTIKIEDVRRKNQNWNWK